MDNQSIIFKFSHKITISNSYHLSDTSLDLVRLEGLIGLKAYDDSLY